MVKRLTVFTLLIASLSCASLGTSVAQDDKWTCDGGPNDIVIAAREAYEANNYETAYTLAAHGQILCIDNHKRAEIANRWRQRAEQALGYNELRTMQPGIVDLGDCGLFLHCMGEGSPTVIFEMGTG